MRKKKGREEKGKKQKKPFPSMGKNRANLMFHVEHCKTQKSAKKKNCGFFLFPKIS